MNEKLERFDSTFYEISSKKTKGGKREIKMVLHEIFSDNTSWQDNGISWKEEYVLKALESLNGAPLAVEFIDSDKKEIWGHGYVGEVDGEDGKIPIFESEVVGSFIDGYIDDTEINGVMKRVLIGRAYIYEQRYKNFVDWLIENIPLGNVMGSVEITGLPEHQNQIVYEGGYLELGRIPQAYCYSGHALLSNCVKPADSSAVVLEINEKLQIKDKEEQKMDEKILQQLITDVKTTIVETNSKNTEYETQIVELNSTITELNASVADLTTALEEVKKEKQELWDKEDVLYKEMDVLKEEIAKAKIKEKVGELNTYLDGFTDEEKAYAQSEIDAFNAEPLTSEINSIVDKIYAEIGKKNKEIEQAKTAEQNSLQTKAEDIFGEVVEINEDQEDSSIF